MGRREPEPGKGMTMTIDFDVQDKIATITLNRPDALNAMSPDMYQKLSESWIEVRDNPDIWVAVICAAPQPNRPDDRQVFSAGADLRRQADASRSTEAPQNWRNWQTQNDQILNRGLEVWKPVVAAINGLCLAGGMTLLLATDIRVGSEYSAYDLSEVKRGILPGNGGTQRTIRQLPYPIAMEVLLAGKRLTAERALQFGLINEIVPHDQVLPSAQRWAEELRAMPPLAVRAIKELAVRGQDIPLHDGLRVEGLMGTVLRQTDDAKEGPRAFSEKRPAVFHGN